MQHSIYQRSAAAILCLVLVACLNFAPIIPGTVRPAHALLGLPGITATIELPGPLLAAEAITAGTNTTQLIIKQVLDGIAWAVAKTAIQSMTKSMVNWINSGFNGSPAFVTNLDQSLQNLSDGVANDFFSALQKNTGINVRSPFQDQVTQALRNAYYSGGGTGYTLNQYSTNPQAFLNGNFSNGGFDAWFAALSNDQNNPLGALHAQQNALSAQIADVRANQLHELDWGRGFLSWRGDCKVTKPAGSPTSLGQSNTCAQYDIKTPGSTVESALGITVTSPLRQLELANSINEIVGALASQLVNQVVGGGGGLSGLSQPASGGGSTYLSQATDPSQYTSSSLATGFVQNVKNDLNNTKKYLADWQKIRTLAQSCSTSDTAVTDAVVRSNANVDKGNAALAALTDISTQANTALTTTNSSATLSALSTKYQSLMSSGTLVSTQDVADADQQSSPAESGSTSLYTTVTNACSGSAAR
ncbi:MAG: hypothetical protein JWL88_155 [Parcubacteria group bacterium]|nr:hypothetical protein [Parcubacteria group bacterium]